MFVYSSIFVGAILKNDYENPKISSSSKLSPAFNMSPLVLFCSHLLKIVVLEHALIFTACINSESKISQDEFYTQVIESVCLMQLVYPWKHLKFMLVCVSKMSDLLSEYGG